jgi:hypothetical protein
MQIQVARVIGVLFKTQKGMTIELANFLITGRLSQIFSDPQNRHMLKFGLLLALKMVKNIGYEPLQAHWSSFASVMINHSSHPCWKVRKCACEGLAVLAEASPPHFATQE